MKLRIYGSCTNVNVKVFIESGIQNKMINLQKMFKFE